MRRLVLPIFITSLIIGVIGVVTLLSTELTAEFLLSFDNIFVKQLIFLILGIIISIYITKFDYTLIKYKPIMYGIYIATILLLILTTIFGQEVNGAKRWISLLGVQLQPSEIAKITVIIMTSYIYQINRGKNEWRNLIISFLAVFPIVLLVYIQPHGSMALLISGLWFITAFLNTPDPIRNILLILTVIFVFSGMFALTAFGQPIYLLLTLLGIIIAIFMYFARDYWRVPVVIVLLGSLLFGTTGSILWNNALGQYQRDRVIAFIDPASTDPNTTFNVNQSKIAIGSGGVFGKGFANGTQSKLQFLPFHQTDFIFAAYAEEFGLIGTIILLTLYFILLWNIFIFPVDYPNLTFESTIVAALGIKILLELFINLGTNLGISPATGIPLPLMSAGGTITIMTFFSLGLIQGIISKVRVGNNFNQ